MNSNFALASLFARSLWAIDKEYAMNRLPFVAAVLDGKFANIKTSVPKFKASVVSAQSNSSGKPVQTNIGVVTIKGELVKDSDWCVTGMQTYGAAIKQLDADPTICGIILKVDSPGGTVDGTYALAEIIKNTKKPIVAYSDGMIASGAYWISSATDHIICDNTTCQVGSIGVMLSFADMQPYYEKHGVNFHQLFADQSSDKWRMWNDVRSGKYEEYKETVLNPLANEFTSKVQSFRSGVDKKALTGEVYFADKAIELGLIDEIGTFDRAIEKVLELAEKSENSQSNSSINKSNDMSKTIKLALLSAILGADHVFSKDGTHLSPDQLEALEQALATQTTSNSSAELDKLKKTNSTLATQIQQLQKAIEKKNTQIANLQNGGGTKTATDTSDAEPTAGEETLVQFAEKNRGNTSAILDFWKKERGL